MAFIYVTGPPGSGKSALAKALRAQGLDAYDEDDPAVGSAHNLETGEPVAIPDVDHRDADWFSRHEWRILDAVKQRLRSKAKTTTVILFGNSVKPADQAKFFDKVCYLQLDEQTLRNRILARTDNDYGKTDHELQQILQRKTEMDDRYRGSDTIIDATKPLEEVATAIKQALDS